LQLAVGRLFDISVVVVVVVVVVVGFVAADFPIPFPSERLFATHLTAGVH